MTRPSIRVRSIQSRIGSDIRRRPRFRSSRDSPEARAALIGGRAGPRGRHHRATSRRASPTCSARVGTCSARVLRVGACRNVSGMSPSPTRAGPRSGPDRIDNLLFGHGLHHSWPARPASRPGGELASFRKIARASRLRLVEEVSHPTAGDRGRSRRASRLGTGGGGEFGHGDYRARWAAAIAPSREDGRGRGASGIESDARPLGATPDAGHAPPC